MKDQIQLGDKVKDLVTGLEGIAIARIEYLNGCIQFGVKPRVKEAALREAEYIDEGQLKWIGDGINPKSVIEKEPRGRPPGGIMSDRPRKRMGK